MQLDKLIFLTSTNFSKLSIHFALQGPLLRGWYIILDRVVGASSGPKQVLAKVAMDQVHHRFCINFNPLSNLQKKMLTSQFSRIIVVGNSLLTLNMVHSSLYLNNQSMSTELIILFVLFISKTFT